MLKKLVNATSTTQLNSGQRKQIGQSTTTVTSRFKTTLEIRFYRDGSKLATSSEWNTSKVRSMSSNDDKTNLFETLAKFVLMGVGAELVRQAVNLMGIL
jgi:hypothetical protein